MGGPFSNEGSILNKGIIKRGKEKGALIQEVETLSSVNM